MLREALESQGAKSTKKKKKPTRASLSAEPFDTTTYKNRQHHDEQQARKWRPGPSNHMALSSVNIWMSLQKGTQPADTSILAR